MCVGYPAKIISIMPDIKCAQIECRGVRTAATIALLENVLPGEYVLVHAGVALEKLSLDRVEEIYSFLSELNICNTFE